MEDFIDYILLLLLLLVLIVTSLLIYLLLTNPKAGYLLFLTLVSSITMGAGILGWKIYKKKHLGVYYQIFQDLNQITKEIRKSTRQLERQIKKVIQVQFPKMRELRREAQKCIYKIIEIDKDLKALEKKKHRTRQSKEQGEQINNGGKYQKNLAAIQESKRLYTQEVYHVLHVFQDIKSQILAMKYAQGKAEHHAEIGEAIDELLIEIQTLEEIT